MSLELDNSDKILLICAIAPFAFLILHLIKSAVVDFMMRLVVKEASKGNRKRKARTKRGRKRRRK